MDQFEDLVSELKAMYANVSSLTFGFKVYDLLSIHGLSFL